MKTITVSSPGRINIIGEHTDYNEGYVLPAAVDKKCIFTIRENGTPHRVTIKALNVGNEFSFDLRDYAPRKEGGWQNYVMGVVSELEKLGAKISGFNGEFSGDVPIGGGMSSSAALECSLAYALNELFQLGLGKWQLIKASQMAEHHFVGIKCGIMDQFASVMGKKDRVMLLDCRSLEFEYFPLELGDYRLLLLNTNVSHALASSEYNTRRSECEEGAAIIREQFPGVNSLRDADEEMLETVKGEMSDNVYRRCRHIITENQRVLAATKAMTEGDIQGLGALIYQSHTSLSGDYEVSCPELDFLVAFTKDKAYVLGSRMMGGGFGGCTINLVHRDQVTAFIDAASEAYRQKFGIDLTPYPVSIEDGTHEIE